MEDEIRQAVAANQWPHIYTDIRICSLLPKWQSVEASRPENRHLNRYRDVYPYDHARVTLENCSDTDYINASLVKFPRAKRQYILSQGPLAATVGHFWLMIWEQKCKAVLMLNRVIEKGQEKCHQYWPQEPGSDYLLEDVGLRVEHVSSVPGEHYTMRKLRLSRVKQKDKQQQSDDDNNTEDSIELDYQFETCESREILHFHYTTWPDFGTPQCPDTFLEFLQAVRDSGSLEEDVGPPVVHCSAGIGRSGTFVLVDTCLVLVGKEGSDAVSIRDTLLELRNYRMGLIQTPEQLKFSYLAIAEGARSRGFISDAILTGLPSPASASSADDDVNGPPPPLPPPRSESLRTSPPFNAHFPSSSSSSSSPATASSTTSSCSSAAARLNGPSAADAIFANGTEENSKSSSSADRSPGSGGGGCGGGSGAGGGVLGVALDRLQQQEQKTDHGSSPTKCILNNHKMEERKREMEIRRRKKEEQRHALESKIEAIKRKAKESEDWEKKKQRLREAVLPFAIGMVVVAVGSVALYFRA